MQYKTVLRMIGILLMLFSFTMWPPLLVSVYYGDSSPYPYMLSLIITFFSGLTLWLAWKNEEQDLKTRDGFLVVVLFWVVLSGFASIPMMLADKPHETLTDAVFETVSGFTTTGLSVVSNVDKLPHAMRYYRQQLEFLGGMGIIVLAVAILPMLSVGGMQLIRAETPGPIKDSKLTPRITETAKALWYIYSGLTLACALAYHFAGMSWFNAIGESFGTVSTGGLAMHDNSFAYYQSSMIEWIAAFFMILGATNFSLHFTAFRQFSLKAYRLDEEFTRYIALLVIAIVIVAGVLIYKEVYPTWHLALTKAAFNVVSLATTTGAVSAQFHLWPSFIPVLLMLLAILGGCAASTGGGIKMIRGLLLFKQSRREMHRLIHPNAIMTIKFGKNVLPEPIIQAMWGFLGAFIALFLLLVLLLMADGLALDSAFGATTAALANAGAAIGDVAEGMNTLPTTSKWILVFAMLAGRLEIFTLLVLFTPSFWRK